MVFLILNFLTLVFETTLRHVRRSACLIAFRASFAFISFQIVLSALYLFFFNKVLFKGDDRCLIIRKYSLVSQLFSYQYRLFCLFFDPRAASN